MKREKIFQQLLADHTRIPAQSVGKAFAPSNIALCKYWGKRNLEINLPITSSLSISLNRKGTQAQITPISTTDHELIINDQELDRKTQAAKQLLSFLNEFNFLTPTAYRLELTFNIPVAAGLASSASAYAAIVKALDNLFAWQLDGTSLSILARLGSGSACRSIFNGFVEWQSGTAPDGMDSYAHPLKEVWSDLCIGLCIISTQEKLLSSRNGMKHTIATSKLYSAWPEKARSDLILLKKAIKEKDFHLLGKTAESNALAMHATMLSAWPPLLYASPETVTLMKKIWSLRENGLDLYFTQDAGANIKLLFLRKEEHEIKQHFPNMEVIYPFEFENDNSNRTHYFS